MLTETKANRRVAQLGRAPRSGRRGRRFKSCHADEKKLLIEQKISAGQQLFYFIGNCVL